ARRMAVSTSPVSSQARHQRAAEYTGRRCGAFRKSGVLARKWARGAASLQPRLERGEPLGGSDVGPFSAVDLAVQSPRGDRALKERQQRKSRGLAAGEECGRVEADARVRETVRVAFDDEAVFETEVAAWQVRRIRHEH